MIRHCKRCLYPSNHALNLILDEAGICSGCRVHEEKDNIDFDKRKSELEKLLESYRNTTEGNYDCIIPVSGGKDSYYIVHLIKNVYKMNPLLVSYNSHFNTPEGIRNLANLRMKFGVDLIQKTVSLEKIKRIVKATMRQLGSIYWHVIAGETVYPVQMAVQLKIPLIIWGAHQGMDQVGMYSHFDYVEMTRKYRKDHDCMGSEGAELISGFDNVTEDDLFPFEYPSNRSIERVGVRGIYLNNYIRWDSRTQHEFVIQNYEYEAREQSRTFDNCSHADCYLYSDVHDYIKVMKHGYGKVNDHVAREIRLGHLTQRDGLKLIDKHLTLAPENLNMFCEWLGIDQSGFWYVMDQFINPIFWKRNEEWTYEYIAPTQTLVKDLYQYPNKKKHTRYSKPLVKTSSDSNKDFILIGKGYNLIDKPEL